MYIYSYWSKEKIPFFLLDQDYFQMLYSTPAHSNLLGKKRKLTEEKKMWFFWNLLKQQRQ